MKNFFLILALMPLLIYTVAGSVETSLPFGGKKPKSCLEIKFLEPLINDNGIYTIYTSTHHPFPVYCDFTSDAPFVWTLIESFNRNIGVWGSKVPNAWHFQRSYTINAPYKPSEPTHWAGYRMTLVNMRSINAVNTTTHWRATCNFNDYATNKTKDIDRDNYIRQNTCNTNIIYLQAFGCHVFDYVVVRGYSCVRCNFPFWASTGYHSTFLASHTGSYCARYKFPGATPAHQESDFGHYNGYSTKHSCASYGYSTANWWLGGLYTTDSHTML